MSGTLSTGTSGVDPSGNVTVYVPPGVATVPKGFTVSYGTYVPYAAGDPLTLAGIGPFQLANGSGVLQPVGTATYRTVTIVAPSGAVDSGDAP